MSTATLPAHRKRAVPSVEGNLPSAWFDGTRRDKTRLGPLADWPLALRYQWAWMCESCQPAILYWGADSICLYNDAFARLIGPDYHPALFTAPARLGWGALWDSVEPEIVKVQQGGEATLHRSRRVPMLQAGVLTDTYWTYGFSPVRDLDDGSICGALCICTDTTIEVEAARRSWETEERYQFAIEASGNIGWWDWDMVGNRLFANAQFARSFGVDPVCALGGLPLDAFMRGIHEADRARVEKKIEHAIANADVFNDEYRIIDEAGVERWIVARGRCYADGAGRPVRFPGTAVDITARKRTETALERKEELLQLAQAAGGVGTFEWNLTNDRVYGSPVFNQLWGLPHGGEYDEGVSASTFAALVHPDDIDELPNSLTKSLAMAVKKGEYRVPGVAGTRWLAHQGDIRFDAYGRPERVVGAIFDITERQESGRRQNALLEDMSTRVDDAFRFVHRVVARTLETSDSLGKASKDIQSRWHTIASVERALGAGKWAHADLRLMLEALLSRYPDELLTHIALSGPAARLCSNSALFLGLSVHELIANAKAFGALSNKAGRVSLTWQIDQPQGEAAALSVCWSESGGPYVSAPAGYGFGLTFLTAGLGALAGHTHVEFDPRGFRFRLTLPVDASAHALV